MLNSYVKYMDIFLLLKPCFNLILIIILLLMSGYIQILDQINHYILFENKINSNAN